MSGELEGTDILNPAYLQAALMSCNADHYKLISATQASLTGGQSFEGGEDPAACAFGRWMAGYKGSNPAIAAALRDVAAHHNTLHAGIRKAKEHIRTGNTPEAQAAFARRYCRGPLRRPTARRHGCRGRQAVDLYDKMNVQLMGTCSDKQGQALGVLDQLAALKRKMVDESRDAGAKETARATFMSAAGMVVGTALALVFGLVLSISLTKALNRVIERPD